MGEHRVKEGHRPPEGCLHAFGTRAVKTKSGAWWNVCVICLAKLSLREPAPMRPWPWYVWFAIGWTAALLCLVWVDLFVPLYGLR